MNKNLIEKLELEINDIKKKLASNTELSDEDMKKITLYMLAQEN